jgi:hypothetical protein
MPLAMTDDEVVGGVRLAVGGDAVEVGHEVGDGLDDARQHVVVALEVFVLRAEQLLGEPQHARVVALGQAEDGEDHVQRVLHRDVAGEVALAAELDHLVDRCAGPARPGEHRACRGSSGGTSRR